MGVFAKSPRRYRGFAPASDEGRGACMMKNLNLLLTNRPGYRLGILLAAFAWKATEIVHTAKFAKDVVEKFFHSPSLTSLANTTVPQHMMLTVAVGVGLLLELRRIRADHAKKTSAVARPVATGVVMSSASQFVTSPTPAAASTLLPSTTASEVITQLAHAMGPDIKAVTVRQTRVTETIDIEIRTSEERKTEPIPAA